MPIKCCYGCLPPKRNPGCHSTCKEYLAEKASWEERKKVIDEQKWKQYFLNDVQRKISLRMQKRKRK